ncbi:MAG: ABC transporter permease [Verrucomicrobiae bacterium]|nr:ABC transporter permease [Verrucomicrobiae bacterium]
MNAVADYLSLVGRAIFWIFCGPIRRKPVRSAAVFTQLTLLGIRSIPMISLLSFFMGLVLAMQGAYQLSKLGADVYVANLTTVAFFREIGPLFAAIVLASRCGSSITAELGTMKAAEEIEALEVMAIDPVRYLVSPRLLAVLLIMPSLAIIANFTGSFGGWVIGTVSLGIDSPHYISLAVDSLVQKDIVTGLIKACIFAVLVATIACYHGMSVSGGAEGVGRATTSSVVNSLIAILSADVVLTALFYFL